jgi:hypothetical protein
MQHPWQLGAQFGNHVSRNQGRRNEVYVQTVTRPIAINPSKMYLQFFKYDSNQSYFLEKIKMDEIRGKHATVSTEFSNFLGVRQVEHAKQMG